MGRGTVPRHHQAVLVEFPPRFPRAAAPLAVSSPPPSCGVRPAPGGRAVPLYALRWGTLAGLPRRAGRIGSAVGAAWPPASGAGGHAPELAAPKGLCISYPPGCLYRTMPIWNWCLR